MPSVKSFFRVLGCRVPHGKDPNMERLLPAPGSQLDEVGASNPIDSLNNTECPNLEDVEHQAPVQSITRVSTGRTSAGNSVSRSLHEQLSGDEPQLEVIITARQSGRSSTSHSGPEHLQLERSVSEPPSPHMTRRSTISRPAQAEEERAESQSDAKPPTRHNTGGISRRSSLLKSHQGQLQTSDNDKEQTGGAKTRASSKSVSIASSDERENSADHPPSHFPKTPPKSVSFENSDEDTAMADAQKDNKANLHALVDMGSNGIRYSITDLSPQTARILPTVFQDRSGISLYDVQFRKGKKVPIPPDVIKEVISELKKFKKTCKSFDVPHQNVQIIATEATRTALNSKEYRFAIEQATGWTVSLLAKEEEGRVGAMGVASSFCTVEGLVMDLGGGSTQLTWLIMKDGKIRMNPKGAISLPYGAAALTQRMESAKNDAAMEAVGSEVTSALINAVSDLDIPEELLQTAQVEGGLRLYLSGGGFRGWGYLLMSAHDIDPYPIPIINGFSIPVASFKPEEVLSTYGSEVDHSNIFRVSKRRASQVPAVAFLIDSLLHALPDVSHIYFAQGGVREGTHFSSLSETVQALPPLTAATSIHAPPSTTGLVKLLRRAIPAFPLAGSAIRDTPIVPDFLAHDNVLVTSLVHLMNYHAPLPKDARPAAGLHSTTTGVLAGVHGLSHESRALLALALCSRWGGEVAPVDQPFHYGLWKLVGAYTLWWSEMVGIIAGAIGDRYPAGIINDDADWIKSRWEQRDVCGHGRDNTELVLEIKLDRTSSDKPGWFKDFERLGKRKSWFKGEGVRTRIETKK